MNCKHARALFSGRLDGELKSKDAGLLHQHLSQCSACASKWASFEGTVRLLRTMPAVAPDPSFVGQVLDRVREYEAGLVSEPSRRRVPSLRDQWADLVSGFSWPRLLMPARLAGAVALGLVVGTLAVNYDFSNHGWAKHGSTTAGSLAGHSQDSAAQVASSSARVGQAPGSSSSDGPFADLARKIDDGASAAADSMAQESQPRASQPYLPGGAGDVGQPVDLDQPHGQSPIIF